MAKKLFIATQTLKDFIGEGEIKMFENMEGRVKELNDEMKLAAEQKEIILEFINEHSGKLPSIVLETLNQKVRQLDIAVKDCEIRLKTYE